MGDRIFLAVILLGVPLFAFAVSYQIESTFEPKWQTAVREQFPDIEQAKLDAMPLRRYCREVAESSELPICSWYPHVQMMQRGSLITAGLGIALISAIFLMSRIAHGNRTSLVLFFKPGLYLTLAALIALSLLHAGLFLTAAILGQIATIGHLIFFGFLLILAIGLGAALCVVLLLRAMILMLRRPVTPVIGRAVSEQRGPLLWQYVRDLARRIDALPPENIVVGFDNNFFVIDADVKCFSGALKGRTLYLSLPLCRILNEPELRAIIGHELGHFKGGDTAYSRRFAPIYRGAGEALATLRQNMSESITGLAILPAVSVLSFFFDSFNTAAMEISRERELVADGIGAQLSGKENAASGLVKAHAFADAWESALQRMRETLADGKTVPNVSALFGDYIAETGSAASFVGLDDQHLAHPMDTHPPLKARLEALGLSLESVEKNALVTQPERRAISVIDQYQRIEEELTEMERGRMENSREVVRVTELRCPACGRLSPVSADVCPCGLRFGRSMG